MENTTGAITITLENDEREYGFDQLGVNFNTPDSEIIAAMAPTIREEFGLDLASELNNGYWTVKRVDSSQNIYIFPKSTAGN